MGCGGNSYAFPFSQVSRAMLANGRLAIETLGGKDKSVTFRRARVSFEDTRAG